MSGARSRQVLAHDAKPPAMCDEDFGGAYMQRWQQARTALCGASSGGGSSSGASSGGGAASSVECWDNPAAPLVACVSRKLVWRPEPQPIGLSCGAGAAAAAGGTAAAGGSAPGGGGGTQAAPGPALGPLPLNAREALKDWLGDDRAAPMAAADVERACAGAGAIPEPVLLVERSDTINTFHAYEYFLTLFTTLELFKAVGALNASAPLRVFFTDKQPDGPYAAFFRRLGATRSLARDPLPPGTCLRAALHAPPAEHATSLFTYRGVGRAARAPLCPPSPVAVAFARWLQGGLFPDLRPAGAPQGHFLLTWTPAQPLGQATPLDPDFGYFAGPPAASGSPPGAPPADYAQIGAAPPQGAAAPRVRVLSVLWASRARHEALGAARLSDWQLQRRVANDAEVAAALLSEVLAWNARAAARLPTTAPRPGGPGGGGGDDGPPDGGDVAIFFEFRSVELSDLPWEDQVHALMRAAVLVGVHGGGLANQVWMEPGGRSAVVEVMHNVEGQNHYAGMAALLGHMYVQHASQGHGVELAGLAERVGGAMDWVARQRRRRRRRHERGREGAPGQ